MERTDIFSQIKVVRLIVDDIIAAVIMGAPGIRLMRDLERASVLLKELEQMDTNPIAFTESEVIHG